MIHDFGDLDQKLDISNISAISCYSGREIARADLMQSLLDNNSSIIRSNSRSKINQDTNEIRNVAESLVLCEENISEHIEAKIIYECVKEVSLNHKNILSKSTMSKLQALLLIHELNKYMNLPSSTKHMQDELTLLGIIDLPPSELTPNEKLDIKCCFETMLREKIHDMLLRYEALGGDIKEALRNNEYNAYSKFLEYHNVPLAQWKNKIEESIQQYESDLLKYKDLINTWKKLKYEDMSQASLEKGEHLLLEAQIAEVQAKLTKIYCVIGMFKETSTTINAFKMLNLVVDEKLKEVTDEIRQKRDVKKFYDNLKNTEYDQVLKEYLQLCNAIKKKKHILEMLK